jgi:hypothetical protein
MLESAVLSWRQRETDRSNCSCFSVGFQKSFRRLEDLGVVCGCWTKAKVCFYRRKRKDRERERERIERVIDLGARTKVSIGLWTWP